MDASLALIDLIWVPIALIVAVKGQRLMAAGLAISCALALRMQIQLIETLGLEKVDWGLLESDRLVRGQIGYSILIALYLILVHFSPQTRSVIFLAATLSLFFSFFVTMFLVLLL